MRPRKRKLNDIIITGFHYTIVEFDWAILKPQKGVLRPYINP